MKTNNVQIFSPVNRPKFHTNTFEWPITNFQTIFFTTIDFIFDDSLDLVTIGNNLMHYVWFDFSNSSFEGLEESSMNIDFHPSSIFSFDDLNNDLLLDFLAYDQHLMNIHVYFVDVNEDFRLAYTFFDRFSSFIVRSFDFWRYGESLNRRFHWCW